MEERGPIVYILLCNNGEYYVGRSRRQIRQIRGRFLDPEEIEKNKKLEKNLLMFVTLAESVC